MIVSSSVIWTLNLSFVFPVFYTVIVELFQPCSTYPLLSGARALTLDSVGTRLLLPFFGNQRLRGTALRSPVN